ncbi:MAG: WbqC family protein [Flavobacteriales bacterium]|nr:WbqC family protein [Flavobacteriales bacterium]
MDTFPLLYFPPISYFIYWKKSINSCLEKFENLPKQTYRNRMSILTPNGKKDITIPINHNGTRLYKDVKISFAENWQRNHWRTLQMSYQSSPYFEYFEDELKELIFFETENLFEYNLNAFNWLLKKLNLNSDYTFTDEYQKDVNQDYRNFFNPKKESQTQLEPYIQVFSDRFDFINDLSIFDFLCNNGPKF